MLRNRIKVSPSGFVDFSGMLVCVLVLSGACLSGSIREHYVSNGIGYEVHDGCNAPCENNVGFEFSECYHETMDHLSEACATYQCIFNVIHYVQCEDGEPTNEADICETQRDQHAVFGTQTAMSIIGPFNCGVEAPSPVPDQPEGDCLIVEHEGIHEGRCFIADCYGTFVNSATRRGRDICF